MKRQVNSQGFVIIPGRCHGCGRVLEQSRTVLCHYCEVKDRAKHHEEKHKVTNR